MNHIIGWLSGAPSAGNQAANQAGGYYQQALNNMINATGSPAATTFGTLQQRALQPEFDRQQQALAAKEAAMGITTSGAAKADFTDLASNQASTLAGATAPLYSGALQDYGAINAAMPGGVNGAYQSAYQGAMQDFYSGLGAAGSFFGGGGFGGGNPYKPIQNYGGVDPTTGSTTAPSGVSTIDNPSEFYSGSPNFNPYASTASSGPPAPYYNPSPYGGSI